MTDKKTFGLFIKTKRMEKNYSQKELAEMLFVTEGAVSKWERGVSYPDITLIADICRILDISEHEFITASTDTTARKLKQEARQFRKIRNVWFWFPTITYPLALFICFICNLAVNHTLSWFFIVLAALLCAYTFIPTVTSFFKTSKLLVFSVSSYLSICLLLFTCAIYTQGISWFFTACIGVLMGYGQVFLPIFLAKTTLNRYKFVISFAVTFVLTVLLLLSVHIFHPIRLLPSIAMTCYAYIPAILCPWICTLRWDAFLKTGICTLLSTVIYASTGHVTNALFGTKELYQINFYDWELCWEGNTRMICFLFFLFLGLIFTAIGISRIRKKR